MCAGMMTVCVCVGLRCVVVWGMLSGVNASVNAYAVGVWVWVCLVTVVLDVCQVCVWCVFGVRQVECEQAQCGGRSCAGGRRAALDVADDIGVRVGLDGVMGVWVW